MIDSPEGLIEHNAMTAVDALAEVDPRTLDLEKLLAMRLKIAAILKMAHDAQMQKAS